MGLSNEYFNGFASYIKHQNNICKYTDMELYACYMFHYPLPTVVHLWLKIPNCIIL